MVNRTELQIEESLKETVARFGCEIWGVELFSAGKRSKLRVYIDKPEGVTIDDCESVSREVGDVLDAQDTFGGGYTLEVSSPGLDRILFKAEHFEANIGATVDVRLNFPFEGRKRFVGLLANIEDAQALLRLDDTEYVLPLKNVQRARLVPQFD
ncbi:MAG: ribosome maturation factor RimP [Gammaproteobacteria bacterium]|nr:ribosome maturation factor RimP [Gammaproteobacteria bacterium]MDE0366994.1 ribosome maturation factor RimP [Gammaproteobacteria bacterium]